MNIPNEKEFIEFVCKNKTLPNIIRLTPEEMNGLDFDSSIIAAIINGEIDGVYYYDMMVANFSDHLPRFDKMIAEDD